MLYACGGVLGLALALGMVRGLLGEGRQQQATLQRVARAVLPQKTPAIQTSSASLLRASDAPPPAPETLLRPAAHEEGSASPEQLLRPGPHD